MRRFWMDLGYGARGLRNQPGFAAIAILTLALGIGASTTIFSVIYNVLLDPFPYTDAKRVVAIQIHDLATGRAGGRQLPLPEMFIPYTMTGAFDRALLVRTATSPMGLVNTVRREIWAVDRNVALTFTGTLEDFLKDFVYAQPRFGFILLGVFAGVGLLLIAIGVYSVIAYTVSRQTHEIGVRMALGAAASDVLGMVFRMGLRLIAIGVVAGVLVTFAATRVISSQLFGVSSVDPVTFGGVIAVIAVTGLAACYFPARRATRVDPMVALRYE